MKLAIIIRAGRPNYRNVVKDLLTSLLINEHSDLSAVTLYISADNALLSANEPFSIDTQAESFGAVKIIRDKQRLEIISTLSSEGVTSERIARLIFLQKPYGYQINSALIVAIADGHDLAVHFDDDQGFAVPATCPGGALNWTYMDVVGAHMRGLLEGATVTSGPVAGLFSPIPQQITTVIPAATLKQLGELFAGAHEFASEGTFLCPSYRLPSQSEVDNSEWRDDLRHEKCWISPANLGINLMKSFPTFYNPPGARGEDAFFTMALDPAAAIVRIPAFIFHDPFLSYPEVYRQRFPSHLREEPMTTASCARIANMIVGWLKYMPLFLRVRFRGDPSAYQTLMREKSSIVESLSFGLSRYLQCPELLKLPQQFREYAARSEDDYNDWLQSNCCWVNDIVPWVRSHHPVFAREQS